MKFAASMKSLILLSLAAILTACGGGGGAGNDSGFNPPGINISATASNTSIGINSSTDVTVRMAQVSGAPIANGTLVSASVSPAGIGNISSLTTAGSTTSPTSGGNATFRFQSGGQTGNATLSFSAQDPTTPGRTASTTLVIAITGSSTGDSRLTISPVRTSLPVNAFNVAPFLGSPYLAEVTITVRTASGQAVNLPDGIQVSVNPVGATGGFSTLDDGTTTAVNEFLVRLGQGPVDVVAGRATIFVHSLNFAGATTLTVTFRDPETGQAVTTTQTFTIGAITPALPADVILSPQLGRPVYVQGAGGNTTTQLEVRVNDANGQPVPDPVSGNTSFNNVRLELLGENAGERLSGLNAQGQNASGTTISVRTTNGIAGVIFTSGTRVGTVVVRATADRADNNVDNGISDPVVTERSVVVSDGRLFNIEITQPIANALTINPVNPGVTPTPGTIPGSPDGSYSVTVAIIATDRLGNPVVPGTVIKFGLIDEPQAGGVFLIAGNDGNPQEAGTLFTAVTGRFRSAGGGAGPGDALVIFGKEVPGNRDLESARVIATVNSETSLTVQRRFNRNDDTGSIVDFGGVLPYVIGRATSATIVADGLTNEFGVARTTMTYPVSRLGRRVIVWAQGDGDIIGGVPETVADVDILSFAGVGPLTLVVSPSTIPANTTSLVSACVSDALGSPIQGVSIGFGFEGLSGSGSVDGTPNSGFLGNLTGPDGCAIARVVTSGVSVNGGTLVFTAGGERAEVDIVRGDLVLQARPSVITSTSTLVRLTLLNGNGEPQGGYQIVGECTGTNGTIVALSNGPGITNANGETTVQVTATNLDQVNQAGGGRCTFQTVDGSATTTVEIIGQDICDQGFSPPPDGCTPPVSFTVTLILTDALVGSDTDGFSVASTPGGISCAVGNGGTQTCTGNFVGGTAVTLTTLPLGTGDAGVTWTGACVPVDGTNPDDQGQILAVTAPVTCNANNNQP